MFTATTQVSSNGGDMTVDLVGSGRENILLLNNLRVSPRVLDFGPVALGATSAMQTVTFTYQSLVVLGSPITDWAGGGFPAGSPFHASQTCAAADPDASCAFHYTFSPRRAVCTATSTISNSRGVYEIVLRGPGWEPADGQPQSSTAQCPSASPVPAGGDDPSGWPAGEWAEAPQPALYRFPGLCRRSGARGRASTPSGSRRAAGRFERCRTRPRTAALGSCSTAARCSTLPAVRPPLGSPRQATGPTPPLGRPRTRHAARPPGACRGTSVMLGGPGDWRPR